MKILFFLYLKDMNEAKFFIQHTLPSLFFEGNRPWAAHDVKESKFLIFTTKFINDYLATERDVIELSKQTRVILENTQNYVEENKPDWFFETAYFKLATVAYAEWIADEWCCPLKRNVIYRENSWNFVLDYMRGNAINALISQPIRMRTHSGLFNVNENAHAFADSAYFNIKHAKGTIYHRIIGCGVLQTSFYKWPVAFKMKLPIIPVLHRIDKDFMQLYFKKDDWLKHLEYEEFGWIEIDENMKNYGYSYDDPVWQIQEWAANGFNCLPINRLIAKTSIPILWNPIKSDAQKAAFNSAQLKAAKLIYDALDVE